MTPVLFKWIVRWKLMSYVLKVSQKKIIGYVPMISQAVFICFLPVFIFTSETLWQVVKKTKKKTLFSSLNSVFFLFFPVFTSATLNIYHNYTHHNMFIKMNKSRLFSPFIISDYYYYESLPSTYHPGLCFFVFCFFFFFKFKSTNQYLCWLFSKKEIRKWRDNK